MALNVYAWPPVGITGWQQTTDRPVARSRSLLTGRDYMSARGRKRRIVRLEVSALARGRHGAGYMEALAALLDGNANLVRIPDMPVNWWLDHKVSMAEGWAATLSGSPALALRGLPPGAVAAGPMDPIRLVTVGSPSTAEVVYPLQPIIGNASGAATIRLLAAATLGTAANPAAVALHATTSAVYRLDAIPAAPQSLTGNWTYSISGREIFADEVGGFTEINPWT